MIIGIGNSYPPPNGMAPQPRTAETPRNLIGIPSVISNATPLLIIRMPNVAMKSGIPIGTTNLAVN